MILSISALILAAGKGTRMNSSKPKVLHTVLGAPMLQYVIDAASQAGCDDIGIVIGGDLEDFADILDKNPLVRVCVQNQRRGTGDAVAAAEVLYSDVQKPHFADGNCVRGAAKSAEYILICLGDTPGLKSETLQSFIKESIDCDADLAVLGMNVPDSKGYGRLKIGADGLLLGIVEEKDADKDEKKINLCNSGVIFSKTKTLFKYLDRLTCDNANHEYYLTDCFEIAIKAGSPVFVYKTDHYEELQGVNTQEQLQKVATIMASNNGSASACVE